MATQIQLRRDTAANWTSNNTVLAAGEFAWESDTNRFKIGDGATAWTALGYASDGDTAGITFVGDDSTGTTVNQNETFRIAGTQNITTAVTGDTMTITGPDLSSLASTSYVDTAVANLVDTAPEALNTLNELAAALGDDANFASTVTSALGHKANTADLATVATSGSYTDLANRPTIPTNNTELTNGAGYITASSTDTLTNKSGNISQFTNDSAYLTAVSQSDVTQHQAALSLTESQITDLTHFSGSYNDLSNKPTIPTNNTELTNGAGYITGVAFADVSAKPTTISGYGITDAFSGSYTDLSNKPTLFSGAYADLSGQPTIPADVSDLTDTTNLLDHFSGSYTDLSDKPTLFSGSYEDLSNKPTIPSNNTELTNGAGYITASSTDTLTNKSGNISQFTNDSAYLTAVSQSDVTQHQAALSITESQITDLTHFSGSYTDLSNKPTIPTNNTELTNGAGYITASSLTGLATETYVDTAVANVVDTAPETLNTLNELAAALGDDANFATTTATSLGNRLRVDTNAQGLDNTQKSNAKTNLGLSTVASTGDYADLTGQPTIPTNNTELTNGAGYITGYTVTEGDVTAHQAALAITESQITDLGAYITGVAFADVSAKPTTISGYGITDAFSGSYTDLANKPTLFSGSYTDLSNQPTIPADVSDLTDTTNLLDHFSGSYTDLTDKPTLFSGAYADLSGKPTLFSGAYADLSGLPTIPTNNNQLTNGAGYITGVAFGDVTSRPTTISGYGITDAFSGAYADLSGKPTLFSGSYTDLSNKPTLFSGSYTDFTNKPTIPSALTDLSITDGTNGQELTTDGAGGFTFTTVAGGGGSATGLTFVGDDSTGTLIADGETVKIAGGSGITTAMSGDTLTITATGGGGSTGDFTFTGNNVSTASSNADFEIGTSGTGAIVLRPRGGSVDNAKTRYDSPVYHKGNVLYYENLAKTSGTRDYGTSIITNIKTDGNNANNANDRYRNYHLVSLDVNGSLMTSNSNYLTRQAHNHFETIVYNSASGGDAGSVANLAGINSNPSAGIQNNTQTSSLLVSNMAGVATTNDFIAGTDPAGTLSVPNSYNFYGNGWSIDFNSSDQITVDNHYGVFLGNRYDSFNSARNPTNIYAFVSEYKDARSKLGSMEQFQEHGLTATHSASGTYTVDANNNLHIVTLGADITSFTMSNFPTSTTKSTGVTLYLCQDGTGGRAVTFVAGDSETFKFANGVNTSTVTAANDIQVVYIFSKYDGTNLTYYWTIGPAYS